MFDYDYVHKGDAPAEKVKGSSKSPQKAGGDSKATAQPEGDSSE